MIKNLVLKAVNFYKKFISPGFGNVCRFYPSCSDYYYQAVKKYGLLKGSFKGVKRIITCNPFCKGGVDLP